MKTRVPTVGSMCDCWHCIAGQELYGSALMFYEQLKSYDSSAERPSLQDQEEVWLHMYALFVIMCMCVCVCLCMCVLCIHADSGVVCVRM